MVASARDLSLPFQARPCSRPRLRCICVWRRESGPREPADHGGLLCASRRERITGGRQARPRHRSSHQGRGVPARARDGSSVLADRCERPSSDGVAWIQDSGRLGGEVARVVGAVESAPRGVGEVRSRVDGGALRALDGRAGLHAAAWRDEGMVPWNERPGDGRLRARPVLPRAGRQRRRARPRQAHSAHSRVQQDLAREAPREVRAARSYPRPLAPWRRRSGPL